MRDLALRFAVLGLVWALTPGLSEAVENLWHLAAAGHAAHAEDVGAGHEPEGEEHGCTGTFHLCSCHHSPPSVLAPASAAASRVGAERAVQRDETSAPGPELPGPFRPPRA